MKQIVADIQRRENPGRLKNDGFSLNFLCRKNNRTIYIIRNFIYSESCNKITLYTSNIEAISYRRRQSIFYKSFYVIYKILWPKKKNDYQGCYECKNEYE